MKLASYLRETRQSTAEFARRINADRTAVHRWLQGRTHPRVDMAQRIVKVTRGVITFADLYGGKPQ